MKIFNQDGFLWRSLDVVADVLFLSLLWLICCLPIVTIGAATTALYDCSVRCVRYGEGSTYKRFFNTFKTDLKTSIFSTLLWLFLIASGLLSAAFLKDMRDGTNAREIIYVAYRVFLVIPIGAACWVFPLLSRFTYKFGSLNLTALRIAIAYLPRTVVLVLLMFLVVPFCLNYVLPIFFMPACTALLASLFIEPPFAKLGGGLKNLRKQIPEHPSEEE